MISSFWPPSVIGYAILIAILSIGCAVAVIASARDKKRGDWVTVGGLLLGGLTIVALLIHGPL